MMKLAVVGSRGFEDLDTIYPYLDNLLNEFGKENFMIITGGALGVDQRVASWCMAKHVACEVIRPIDPKNKVDYLYRNIEIVAKANAVLAFWDGKSKGTKFTVDYARRRNKLVTIITLPEQKTLNSS